ncbi:Ribonuclease H-like superfamily [Arabidopsis thaliana x Arabidopsis arenosa]|uniref:Ribonuclease H-like superfamily n=1 Tax=Arabidopsis thaliana x Arabidopsis arenosa TaxID=1240361 RepID=A0A8T2ANP6_9BRAS|nr:Ribonuclease H-like superfamily [Arabidopsis thaliana x Arabidopsis arenosa]
MKVSDLWLENRREWDPVTFEGVLNPEDQELAKKLYISKYAEDDTYEWAYTKNAQYTVRSGYWVATHITLDEEDHIQPPQGSLTIKQQIWKLPITPKIKHFLWRCLSGALATTTQLRSRTIPADPICQRCCQAEETTNHLLFLCSFAQAVWRCASTQLGRQFSFSDNLEDNITLLLQRQQDQTISKLHSLTPFWIMWRLWKSRNAYLFQKINRSAGHEAIKGSQEAMEWLEVNNTQVDESQNTCQSSTHMNRSTRNSHWSPPPQGWLKCNFDSGYVTGRDFTTTGWIFRDWNGKALLSGCARLPKTHSVLEAEAFGFLHVLQMAWIKGFRNVWFECDNLELTTLINKWEDHVSIGSLLYDIRHWMMKLPLCSLAHVNREKNSAADALSRQASSIMTMSHSFITPPSPTSFRLLVVVANSNPNNATQSVATVVQQHHTRSHACSFASSVAKNVFVFLLVLTATNKVVHVTTTGRLKKAAQNVLNTSY